MNVRRIAPGEWAVAAGLALMTIGVSLSYFKAVARFDQGTISIGLSGWTYTLGWLAWALVLVALAAVALRHVPGVGGRVAGYAGTAVVVLGAVALVLVVVKFLGKPSEEAFGRQALQHVGIAKLQSIGQKAASWTNSRESIERGLGIYVSLAAPLAVIGGALLVGVRRAAGAAHTVAPPSPAPPAGSPPAAVAPAGPASAVAATASFAPPLASGGPAAPAAAAAGGVVQPATAPPGATPQGGTPAVGSASPAAVAPAAFCVKCGAPHRDSDERFCTRCGAPRWGG